MVIDKQIPIETLLVESELRFDSIEKHIPENPLELLGKYMGSIFTFFDMYYAIRYKKTNGKWTRFYNLRQQQQQSP
jgi:hypothetical protein